MTIGNPLEPFHRARLLLISELLSAASVVDVANVDALKAISVRSAAVLAAVTGWMRAEKLVLQSASDAASDSADTWMRQASSQVLKLTKISARVEKSSLACKESGDRARTELEGARTVLRSLLVDELEHWSVGEKIAMKEATDCDELLRDAYRKLNEGELQRQHVVFLRANPYEVRVHYLEFLKSLLSGTALMTLMKSLSAFVLEPERRRLHRHVFGEEAAGDKDDAGDDGGGSGGGSRTGRKKSPRKASSKRDKPRSRRENSGRRRRASTPPPEEIDEEAKAKATLLFNHCDKDNSGYIDEDELKLLLRDLLEREVSAPEVNRIYADMDADHSGRITIDEFLKSFVKFQWMSKNADKVLEKRPPASAATGGDAFAWEIPSEELLEMTPIGKGSFGEVYRARWGGMDVAVKTLFAESKVSSFQKEIDVMSRLRHPHVLLYMGASTADPSNCMMVFEYLVGGNLGDICQASGYVPSVPQITKWSKETLLGLNYLHLKRILHRDLKLDNIMLDANDHVKLVDFGLSTVKNFDTVVIEKQQIGTPLFMAPEVLASPPGEFAYSEMSDVYAFGLCVYHFFGLDLLEDDPEYRKVDNLDMLKDVVVTRGVRPMFTTAMPADLRDIMRSCWQAEPERRRDCAQLLADVEAIEWRLWQAFYEEGDSEKASLNDSLM